jgi:hypothetical protein
MAPLPTALAVTLPFDTSTIAGALDDHVTFWFVALLGAIMAVRVASAPTFRVRLVSFRVTFATRMVMSGSGEQPIKAKATIAAITKLIFLFFIQYSFLMSNYCLHMQTII